MGPIVKFGIDMQKLSISYFARSDAHEEAEKERLAIEVFLPCSSHRIPTDGQQAEEARTKGTPVTVESFTAWKVKFDKEMTQKRAREEEEKLKGLSPKEREEYKKMQTRLSGRCLSYHTCMHC